jgi:hypothetical protein
MCQPRVIETIAANPDFKGRGLLARFLYAWPPSRVGRRKIAAEPVSEAAEQQYRDHLKALAIGVARSAPFDW